MPTHIDLAAIRARHHRTLIESSLLEHTGAALWMERRRGVKWLMTVSRARGVARLFAGESEPYADGLVIKRSPLTHANARGLREALAWLTPRPMGMQTSFGFGDRLGLATPGHVSAMHIAAGREEGPIRAIFAQQSIREMARTERTPEDVMSDATFGAFQAGWRQPVGADADHLKTSEDIDRCVAAGYSFYTLDPSAHVDNSADTGTPSALEKKAAALDWTTLGTTLADTQARFVGQKLGAYGIRVAPSRAAVVRAAVKYGNAIAHVARLARHLASRLAHYDLEVSVDETDAPTTHFEHFYIASELARLGVNCVSLAPRFVGRFEKGVDFIGDLGQLRLNLLGHAAVAKGMGTYKLSLHSGSDKFSVYPLLREAMGEAVHVKTAGTSYLEALRVCAMAEPALFREIAGFARGRYAEDMATYHVSADMTRVPLLDALTDEQLGGLIDPHDSRQMLHVTFGSVLKQYRKPLMAMLRANEAAYAATLTTHFHRHLMPFV